MLYFAYGSNMWQQQMRERCPASVCIGSGMLSGYRWIITGRGYASIVSSEDDKVYGTVYELTTGDEKNLDLYEGVADGFYSKELLSVDIAGTPATCLVYVDMIQHEGAPKDEYIIRINNGIADARLPYEYVASCIRKFVPA